MEFLALPVVFAKFWFLEAPIGLFRFFLSLNSSALHFLSFSTLIKTFFKPIKNEYRKGLVGFSIGMGIFVKSFLILTSIFIVGFMFVAEVVLTLAFVALPVLSFSFLFI